MHVTLTTLLDRLDSPCIAGTDVIRWGSPVPSFGDLLTAKVASLGLNPSNREFVDETGKEIQGAARRFHTLRSLGIDEWSEADARDIEKIILSCRYYFVGNPYDRWFRKLDQVVSGTGASYYDALNHACHLDLIPYATQRKWTDLTSSQRSALLRVSGNTLGVLLRDSNVRTLILNGNSVVHQFQDIAGIQLEQEQIPSWALPRRSKPEVLGIAYTGVIRSLAGVPLERDVLVLGFNHNLQSSYGVTNKVISTIRMWVLKSLESLKW